MDENQAYQKELPVQPRKDGREKHCLHRKMIILETKGHEKREVSSSADSSDSQKLLQQTGRRKESARRQLLGSIYTKHKAVGRSFSFVAGEKPPVQIRFPRVYYKEKTEKDSRVADRLSPKPTIPHAKRKHSKISDNTSGLPSVKSKPVHRTNSQKLSLPDIIMDFNTEVNMAANDRTRDIMTQDTESENDERIIGASYEEYLKPKISLGSPYQARHRPVTPGLLDSLNKLKLPSKVKTEQWLKNSQSVQKSYCVGSYNVGNLHNSNLTYPNWIYTDS